MKTTAWLIILYLSVTATVLFGQPGSLDMTFGNGDGYELKSLYPEKHSYGNDLDVYPDGRLLLACATSTSQFSEAVLLRLLPDGEPDNSFNGNGKLYISYPGNHISGYATDIEPDGKIVMITALTNNNTFDSMAIYRFHENGLPDNSFSDDGLTVIDFGYDYQEPEILLRQADGKYIIAGYVGNVTDTFDQFFISRLLPNGQPDPLFDGDGIAVVHYGQSWTYLDDIKIQPDGKYVACGYSTTHDQEDMIVMRFNTNGTLDQTFSGDGFAPVSFSSLNDDSATGLALLPDGKILVTGSASISIGNPAFAIARLTSNGELDPGFHGDGMNIIQVSPEWERSGALLLQPDGSLIMGGSSRINDDDRHDFTLLRVLPNGLPDLSFDEDGISIIPVASFDAEIRDMAFTSDGKVVFIGRAFSSYSRLAYGRIHTGITVSTNDQPVQIAEFTTYPNPIIDQVSMRYSLLTQQTISMNISDAQGRMVQQLMPATSREAGRHDASYRLSVPLPAGMYFVNLTCGSQTKSVSVVVQ